MTKRIIRTANPLSTQYLNWPQFMFRWFIRFPDFAGFTEFPFYLEKTPLVESKRARSRLQPCFRLWIKLILCLVKLQHKRYWEVHHERIQSNLRSHQTGRSKGGTPRTGVQRLSLQLFWISCSFWENGQIGWCPLGLTLPMSSGKSRIRHKYKVFVI